MTTRSSAAALICVGAALAAGAPAAQAASSSSSDLSTTAAHVQGRGLLDGLLGPIAGAGASTAPVTPTVTSLVGQIAGTTATSGLSLGQLTSVVATLVETGALGAVDEGTLLADVPVLGELLDSTVQSVTGGALSGDLVGRLLQGGVPLGSLPAVVDQLLSGAGAPSDLVDALVGRVVGDVLAVGLPTDATLLDGALGALRANAPATGSLLEPVAGVLGALAANTALPVDLRTVAGDLATRVRAAGDGLLGADLLGAVSDLLGGVAGTANASRPVTDAMAGLSHLLRARSNAMTALPTTRTPFRVTKAMRVKVRSVKVSKDRRKARAVIVCPVSALAGCHATSRLRWGGKDAGRSVVTILRPGQARAISLRLPAKARRSLARRGGRVGVRAVTLTQDGKVSASRTETVARARR